MKTNKVSKVVAAGVALLSASAACTPSAAASSGPLKVGYISLEQIRQQVPDLASGDTLRLQGESQMQNIIKSANEQLAKAQADKKPKEEIDKMQHDLQNQVAGMQQGLLFAVGLETNKSNQRIHQVAEEVAKERGLDIVVDGGTIFAGGEKLVASGENITDLVLKQLQAKAPGK